MGKVPPHLGNLLSCRGNRISAPRRGDVDGTLLVFWPGEASEQQTRWPDSRGNGVSWVYCSSVVVEKTTVVGRADLGTNVSEGHQS